MLLPVVAPPLALDVPVPLTVYTLPVPIFAASPYMATSPPAFAASLPMPPARVTAPLHTLRYE
jgi:hypothetical protein